MMLLLELEEFGHLFVVGRVGGLFDSVCFLEGSSFLLWPRGLVVCSL